MPVSTATDHISQTWAELDSICTEALPFHSEAAEKYLEPDDAMRSGLHSVSQKLYKFMKDFETTFTKHSASLDALLVSGFDNEQIWQQIELQNTASLSKMKKSVKSLDLENICLNESTRVVKEEKKKKKKDRKRKAQEELEEEEVEDDDEEDMGMEEGEEEDEDEDEDEEGLPQPLQINKKYKSTEVDDEFFQLRQMEDCLDELDAVMNNDTSKKSNKNLFEDGEDEEADGGLTFNDFFDPPAEKGAGKKKEEAEGEEGEDGEEEDDFDDLEGDLEEEMEDDLEDDEGCAEEGESVEEKTEDTAKEEGDEEEEDDTGVQSTFERKQKQMQKKIEKLEAENLSDKPWQLSGEALAKARPMNSLLEEYVSFDHTTVGAPTITEETTLSLEDMIKRRVKDQAWDDVVRKEKPVVQPFEYKKAPELNQEKSKISLAEVYEKEYLKEVEGEKKDEENPEHVEIEKLMDKLFVQLDALSNFHFAPKPAQPEVKIITNTPSLEMEEVLPITMTDASQLAPEEILEKKKGELVGEEERTDEDRKRDRRQKKIKKKFAAKAREKKEKAGKVAKSDRKQAVDALAKGVRNTIVDAKSSKSDKPVKGSNDFFNKLQDEVKGNISKEASKGKKEDVKKRKTAESLKL